MTKKAQFKDVTFASTKAFNSWLKTNTSQILTLKDFGQDLQRIWIHETGEILYCDFQAAIYNGKFVNLETLKAGTPIEIWDVFNDGTKKFIEMKRLILEDVEIFCKCKSSNTDKAVIILFLMNIVFIKECAVDGCYERNTKGKQMCNNHQLEYEQGKALKAFYGKTVQKKEFQSNK